MKAVARSKQLKQFKDSSMDELTNILSFISPQ